MIRRQSGQAEVRDVLDPTYELLWRFSGQAMAGTATRRVALLGGAYQALSLAAAGDHGGVQTLKIPANPCPSEFIRIQRWATALEFKGDLPRMPECGCPCWAVTSLGPRWSFYSRRRCVHRDLTAERTDGERVRNRLDGRSALQETSCRRRRAVQQTRCLKRKIWRQALRRSRLSDSHQGTERSDRPSPQPNRPVPRLLDSPETKIQDGAH